MMQSRPFIACSTWCTASTITQLTISTFSISSLNIDEWASAPGFSSPPWQFISSATGTASTSSNSTVAHSSTVSPLNGMRNGNNIVEHHEALTYSSSQYWDTLSPVLHHPNITFTIELARKRLMDTLFIFLYFICATCTALPYVFILSLSLIITIYLKQFGWTNIKYTQILID